MSEMYTQVVNEQTVRALLLFGYTARTVAQKTGNPKWLIAKYAKANNIGRRRGESREKVRKAFLKEMSDGL